MDYEKLAAEAITARNRAYAPYSDFHVGAALLAKSGRIYSGCNIESAALTPGSCAERTALYKAISEGEHEFVAIAVVGGKKDAPLDFCYPCGVCRQMLREFANDDFVFIIAKSPEEFRIHSLNELLPHSFGPNDLEE